MEIGKIFKRLIKANNLSSESNIYCLGTLYNQELFKICYYWGFQVEVCALLMLLFAHIFLQ